MLRRSLLSTCALAAALLLSACSLATPEEAALPPDMQHALQRYRQAPGVKLFVLTVDPVHGWIWNLATGQLTAKDARLALEYCEQERLALGVERPCTVYLRGDRRVAPLPEEPERQLPRYVQAALDEYEALDDHRAFAMAVDVGGNTAWGTAHSYSTPEEAEAAALALCEEARVVHEVRSPCEPWLSGDRLVRARERPEAPAAERPRIERIEQFDRDTTPHEPLDTEPPQP